jgi:hypothetical protein
MGKPRIIPKKKKNLVEKYNLPSTPIPKGSTYHPLSAQSDLTLDQRPRRVQMAIYQSDTPERQWQAEKREEAHNVPLG